MISSGTLNMTGKLFIRGEDEWEECICPIKHVDTLEPTAPDAESNHDYAFFSGDREISFTVQCLNLNPLQLRMAIWGLTTKRQQHLVIRHMKWWKKYRKKTGKGPPFDDILLTSIMEVGGYIKRPKRRV